jgi:hypothetical protein
MKFTTPLLVILLVASVIGNVMLYKRASGGRVEVSINDKPITKRNLEMYLADRFKVEALAQLTRNELARQAAKQAGVPADDKEITETIQLMKETQPKQALLFDRIPTKEFDAKQELEYQLNMLNIAVKDVKATDDEIKEHFEANPGKWDKPTKMHMKVMVCDSAATAQKTAALMKDVDDMSVVQSQIDPKRTTANLVGIDGSMVALRAFSKAPTDPVGKEVDGMKEGEVKVLQPQPGQFMVIKRGKTEQGKAVTLDEVKAKVERDFKRTRAIPAQEVLAKLWGGSKIVTDDPNTTKQLKWLLLRDRSE